MNDNARVVRDEKTASRILAGEAVILTPEDSKIHSLNDVGSRVWELLADKPTVGAIVADICEGFEVDEATARQDVTAFLETLRERGMVVVEDPGGG